MQNLIIVISGPSGAGKSTLCQALLKRWPNLRYSISSTTRTARATEIDGHDYYFLSEAEFQKKIGENEFLEWARVHDCYYGTPLTPVTENLKNGRDVIFDVDPQGALALRKRFPDSVGIYICPPTWESLANRLRLRAQDNEDAIAKRLANARKEMAYLLHYEYVVVNSDLNDAVEDVSAIIRAERRRVSRLDNDALRLGILEEEKA